VALISLVVLGTTSLIVLGGLTWAALEIRRERAHLRRVPAEIIEVLSSRRSSFHRSIKFGRYRLRVRYRSEDGRISADVIQKSTYGFPSAGDRITLLIDPQSGHKESNPFPELWFLLAVAWAFLGGINILFVVTARKRFAEEA